MELKTALLNIKIVRYKFAKDEIMCIREHKEEAIPTLISYVKAVIDFGENIPEDYQAYDYAMFLLAEFRVKEAFQYLIKFLDYDYDTVDWLLGDTLFECFGSILASCAVKDDIPAIKSYIENQKLDWSVRLAALESLVVLSVEGVYPRNEMCEYFGYLLKNFSDDDDEDFVSFVVDEGLDFYASDYFDLMRTFFVDGMLGDRLMDTNDFEKVVSIGEEKAIEILESNHRKRYINDVIKSMSWWACFKEKPDFGYKVGRNEPCPCGSGKKYKKCCGG